MKPLGRPQITHLFLALTRNLGGRFAFSIIDVRAIAPPLTSKGHAHKSQKLEGLLVRGRRGRYGNIHAPHFVDLVVIYLRENDLLAKTDRLDLHSENHILTPHPGEFARLAPELAGMTRETAARTFADRFPGVLLLKGARTIVTQRDAPLLLNPTGTPGMATGGQGDLLTGVIAALCASGLPPLGAAAQAAWLCGHASEMAIRHGGQSEESLTPSDTACHFGAAFEAWRAGLR